LYSLASSPGLFRDIADGVSNAFSFETTHETLNGVAFPTWRVTPGYKLVEGWDACTGLGVLDGTKLLEALK